ncbi:MAG: hypothetical protein COA78_18295 [Blastopirellula sp.]|nr:MAG: hypothetical protein COA78_18295 [Blastopirellula sp.]
MGIEKVFCQNDFKLISASLSGLKMKQFRNSLQTLHLGSQNILLCKLLGSYTLNFFDLEQIF